jgi:manganese/zinc/iron transport system substrate-binding protein
VWRTVLKINRRNFVRLSAAAFAAPSIVTAKQNLDIVCTVGMLADTTKQIAPSNVTIRALMGPGTDPHSYRQTRSDVVALAKADLIIPPWAVFRGAVGGFVCQTGSAKNDFGRW